MIISPISIVMSFKILKTNLLLLTSCIDVLFAQISITEIKFKQHLSKKYSTGCCCQLKH